LKTPLTVLRAGVERAITHPSASPELMEVLEETLIEVNLMTEIVDSLLTLARVDEGRAPLHLEPTDIRDLLGEISETANLLGEQAHVNVTVEDPAHPLVLPLDRARVRQLLLNLLTNAIKFTPRGGDVSITCAEAPEAVVVVVADTGIGIASGDLPHVFDRFWRAEATRSRVQRQGSGLGLAICRWIAEAHGGSIEVKSRRGDGTTFTVTLPRESITSVEVAKA
jgi:signal transduction histidine kinase